MLINFWVELLAMRTGKENQYINCFLRQKSGEVTWLLYIGLTVMMSVSTLIVLFRPAGICIFSTDMTQRFLTYQIV